MLNYHIYIEIASFKTFFNQVSFYHLSIDHVVYETKGITCYVDYHTYQVLSLFYPITLLESYNKKGFFSFLKQHVFVIYTVALCTLLFLFLSRFVIRVDYPSMNETLRKELTYYLEENGIKHLGVLKSDFELKELETSTLGKFNTSIEWISIKRVGMTYQIFLQEKKQVEINEDPSYCEIKAIRDGLVTRYQYSSGNLVVHKNSYVHTGDTLISGDIIFNEEVKNQVCAKGTVYGEVWFHLSLSIPLQGEFKTYTGKTFYNLSYEDGIYDVTLLKSKYSLYEVEKIKLLSLLGHSLSLQKEIEYAMETRTYSDEELESKVQELVEQTISLNLNKEERILYQKVLKKETNDSTMDIELFIVAEKIIGENE